MNCNTCGKQLVSDDRIEGLLCNNPECESYQVLI